MNKILKFGAALTITIIGIAATIVTGKDCFFDKITVREIDEVIEEVF